MSDESVAILGAGVIGASWAALFLAAGRSVTVFDPSPSVADDVRAYVDRAWPTLTTLRLTDRGAPDRLRFVTTAAKAVEGANFIQESVPERLPVKHALYAEIEPALAPGAVVASSASGLTLTEMQGGWADPAPLVLGHPFNPPHLIPLVEVMGNAATAPEAVAKAEAVYADIGKVTIRVNREVPGHVANRLQAAVWREAIHLVSTGVASVEDVDTAMWAGPGLRWATMGPTLLFHLGAGDGGLAAFCDRYSDSFNRWWDDLGTPHLTPEIAAKLVQGVASETSDKTPQQLSETRDEMLTAVQSALLPLRHPSKMG